MHAAACMWRSEQLWGGQFSPSTFMWVPRIDLGNIGSQARAAGAFTSPPHPSHLTAFPHLPSSFFFIFITFIYFVFVCFCIHTRHGQVWRSEENLQESALPLSLCWSGGLNSGRQPWHPLPSGLFLWNMLLLDGMARTLYRTSWSWTQSKPPASPFQMLGLYVCNTINSFVLYFIETFFNRLLNILSV